MQEGGFADGLGEVESMNLEGQPAGLDARDVEDVVDDRQQVPRRLGALFELPDQDRVGGAAQRQFGHPDDPVERGAQFVAHVGQENALCPVGRFRRVTGLGEFRRARDDEIFQMVAMLLEFLLDPLAFADVVDDREDQGTSVDSDRGAVYFDGARFAGSDPVRKFEDLFCSGEHRVAFVLTRSGRQHVDVADIHPEQHVARITVEMLRRLVGIDQRAARRFDQQHDRCVFTEHPREAFLGIAQAAVGALQFADRRFQFGCAQPDLVFEQDRRLLQPEIRIEAIRVAFCAVHQHVDDLGQASDFRPQHRLAGCSRIGRHH